MRVSTVNRQFDIVRGCNRCKAEGDPRTAAVSLFATVRRDCGNREVARLNGLTGSIKIACSFVVLALASALSAHAQTGQAGTSQVGPRPGSNAHSPAHRPVAQPAARRFDSVAHKQSMPAVHGPGHYRPHRHVHGPSVRVWFGPPPIYYAPTPYWAHPPYLYRPVPPVVVVPAAPPPVYVERGPEPPVMEAPRPGFWYWCESRAAYHPAAPDCPEGWIQVPPQAGPAQ